MFERLKGDFCFFTISVILLIVTVFMFNDCKHSELVTTEEIEVVKRDTIFVTEQDSSIINALLHCDSIGNVYMTLNDSLVSELSNKGNRNAFSTIAIKDNFLVSDCFCDTLQILATMQDSVKTITKVLIVEVEKEFSEWQKALIAIGAFSSMIWIIIIYLLIKDKLND